MAIKKFGGNKSTDEIIKAVKANGWNIATAKYGAGGDWITFEFHFNDEIYTVVYNAFNGRFMVKIDDDIITESRSEFDDVPWYSALLDFIYLPEKEGA